MSEKYNYSYLRGLIIENFGTIEKYAKYLNLSNPSIHARLNGEIYFKQNEIEKSIKGFELSEEDIPTVFFSRKTKENL